MKFSPKRLILIILCVFGLLAATVFVRMASAPGVPVLNYHQVEDKDGNPLTLWTDQFEAQMAYLAAEGYTTITIDEMLPSASVPRRTWSSRRPGVPMTSCGRRRSFSFCRSISAPP